MCIQGQAVQLLRASTAQRNVVEPRSCRARPLLLSDGTLATGACDVYYGQNPPPPPLVRSLLRIPFDLFFILFSTLEYIF